MTTNLSRRGALGALVAFTTAPAIALPAPADPTNALWAERQNHVERLAQLCAEYSVAHDKLPAWALPGLERIDANGDFCGELRAWPLVEDLTPPSVGERIVRPSVHQAKKTSNLRSGCSARRPRFGRAAERPCGETSKPLLHGCGLASSSTRNWG